MTRKLLILLVLAMVVAFVSQWAVGFSSWKVLDDSHSRASMAAEIR